MKINYAALYAIALGVFVLFDGVWLGVVSKKLYAEQLGKLMTDNVKWFAAGLFYTLFIGLLIYFVIAPALQSGSMKDAAVRGALFGLATYMTYDLTNYATLKGFPGLIVVVDILWGMTLSLLVSVVTWSLYKRLF